MKGGAGLGGIASGWVQLVALTVALGGVVAGAGAGPLDPSFPQIIKKLIERKQAQIRKVYPGLSCFKEGVRQIPVESVPGIRKQRSRLRGSGGTLLGVRIGILRDILPLPTLQERRAGSRWGRRRGECFVKGARLGAGQRDSEPQTWCVSPQEGAEGPRPALHNPQKPAGPNQGGETRLPFRGPCTNGCGLLMQCEVGGVLGLAWVQQGCPQLGSSLQSHPSAWPFMEPVKKSEAPDYYEVIRFPIGEDPPFHLLPPSSIPIPAPALTAPCSPMGPTPVDSPAMVLSLLKLCSASCCPRPEDHD